MYRDFTLVDTQNRPFNWKITFARTLRRFRSAVHRYAVHIRWVPHAGWEGGHTYGGEKGRFTVTLVRLTSCRPNSS